MKTSKPEGLAAEVFVKTSKPERSAAEVFVKTSKPVDLERVA